MVLLTDDQQNPMSQPTKANILRAMHWLVKDAQPNDSLFFHYSGHGGQTKDLDGDEEDGYDEVIYPVDFRTAGHIVDDDMHDIMVKQLKAGVRLTAIFDSCHSGSALDLPYIYSTQGLLKEPNLAKEAGQGLLGIVSSYARGDLGGMASTAMGLFKKAVSGDEVYKRNLTTKTSAADVIMWSGSKDDQTSYVNPLPGISTMTEPSLFLASLSSRLGPAIAPAPFTQAQIEAFPYVQDSFHTSYPLNGNANSAMPVLNSHFALQHATVF